jgi:hypothetical protein
MPGTAELGTTYAVTPSAMAGWLEAFTDVTTDYPLGTSVNDGSTDVTTIGNPTNLTPYRVRQSVASKTIYVKIGGELTGATDFSGNGLWGQKATGSPTITGKWADIAFGWYEAIKADVSKVLAVRSSSFALYYYYHATDTLRSKPALPVVTGHANIYIPSVTNPTATTDIPFKWRMYNAGTFVEADPSNPDPLGILLWSDAPVKIITIEIVSHASFVANANETGDIAKFVIDYSGVTIN